MICKLLFKEINVGKYKSVRHFELISDENGNPLKSNKVQLSKNREFARSNPDFWLKSHNGKKWSKTLTGVFKTAEKNTYFGDLNYKTHLIVMHLDGEELSMRIHTNYYPFHKNDHPTTIGKQITFYKKK